MFKFSPWLFTSSILFSPLVLSETDANPSGVFIGLNPLNRANLQLDDGSTLSTFSWTLYGGYRFTNKFSVELLYSGTSNYYSGSSSESDDINPDFPYRTLETQFTAIAPSYTLPLDHGFSLNFKGGPTRFSLEEGPENETVKQSGTGLLAYFGIHISRNPRWETRIGYTIIPSIDLSNDESGAEYSRAELRQFEWGVNYRF